MRTLTIVIHVEDEQDAAELAHNIEHAVLGGQTAYNVLNIDVTNDETDADEAAEIRKAAEEGTNG